MSRRKFKSERELVADINKTFSAFCNRQECRDCAYRYSEHCKLDYVADLLQKDYEESSKENN